MVVVPDNEILSTSSTQLLIQQNLLLSEIPFRQALTSKKDLVMLLAVLNSSVLLQALVPNHLVARSWPCLCPVPTKPMLLLLVPPVITPGKRSHSKNHLYNLRNLFMFQLAIPLLMHLLPLLSPMRLGSSG